MKLLPLFLLLLSSLSWAQTSLSEITDLNYGFGNTLSSRLRRSEEILKTVKEVALDNGIQTKEIRLKTPKGETYPALQILPVGSHPVNIEAKRIEREMTGLPLIFSPYDLAAGSNAFFDPNGSKLGVPYDFFSEGANSSSYQHELIHAGMYASLMKGTTPFWSGLVKLIKGTYVTDVNTNYYFRFSANDEILATALSIKLDALILQEYKRVMSPREFNNYHGKAAKTLNEIYFGTLAGSSLAKQTQSLTTSALKELNKAIITEDTLTLGRAKKKIFVVEFKLNAFERAIEAGRGYYRAVPEGTSFWLYFASRPTRLLIETKLKQMNQKATQSLSSLSAIEKSIPILIEFPQIEKTNVEELVKLSPAPFNILSRY